MCVKSILCGHEPIYGRVMCCTVNGFLPLYKALFRAWATCDRVTYITDFSHHRSFHGPLGSNVMNALKTEPSLKDLRTKSDRRCHMILLLFHLLTMVYTTLVT